MRDLLRDMLIWLATFSGASLLLMCVIRVALGRMRKRRTQQLKAIEARCSEVPEDLELPPHWRTAPKSCQTAGYRWIQAFQWTLPLGLLIAGATWLILNKIDWKGTSAGVILSLSLILFLTMTLWLSWRRQTTVARQSRRLALALRCWSLRLESGIESHLALEQTARQMRRTDPEMATQLELAAAETADAERLQHAFYPFGTGLAERLTQIASGHAADPTTELRNLASRLDNYYLSQALSRTRLIDGWMKYPIALCLVPAVNLVLFGPAITNLLEKFGTMRFAGRRAAQVQPLEPVAEQPVAPVKIAE